MEVEKIKKMINDKLVEIGKVEDPVQYVGDMTNFLRTMHPSDAYTIIRDVVVPKKNRRLYTCRDLDVVTYQNFQDLMVTCKASFDHDRAYSTNLDVDKAISKAYGIAMRVLRANMDMEKARFDKLTTAINRIEEHLGIDATNFGEDDKDDTTEHEDAQGVEEIVGRIGEPCNKE